MSDDLDLDDLEHVAVDECDHEGTIVPVDADWARCTKCGDSTFPLSYRAAYGSGQPVELVGTINGKVMIGEAFGNTALLFRAQEAEKERDQLNTRVAEMQKSLGNVIRQMRNSAPTSKPRPSSARRGSRRLSTSRSTSHTSTGSNYTRPPEPSKPSPRLQPIPFRSGRSHQPIPDTGGSRAGLQTTATRY